jgi:hypothetical protein
LYSLKPVSHWPASAIMKNRRNISERPLFRKNLFIVGDKQSTSQSHQEIDICQEKCK